MWRNGSEIRCWHIVCSWAKDVCRHHPASMVSTQMVVGSSSLPPSELLDRTCQAWRWLLPHQAQQCEPAVSWQTAVPKPMVVGSISLPPSELQDCASQGRRWLLPHRARTREPATPRRIRARSPKEPLLAMGILRTLPATEVHFSQKMLQLPRQEYRTDPGPQESRPRAA